jgi:RES domain-containing protein
MPETPATLWRVFPWDRGATDGAPFSASFLPTAQGAGRFDLPGDRVLYLAETAEHAVAEKLQRFRGQEVGEAELEEFGRRLALVPVTLPAELRSRVADLCDPGVLARHGIAPDEIAARRSATSQRVAVRLDGAGFPGLRWWSSFWGEWHTVVLFTGRTAAAPPSFGEAEALSLEHAAVRAAAGALGVRLG